MVRLKCNICGQLTPMECTSEALAKDVFPVCPLCGSKWDADPDDALKWIMGKLEKRATK